MNYKNITVAGGGVLGSQIAFQTAYKGFHVNVYDISDQVLGQAKERLTKLRDNYKEDLRATPQTVDEAFSRISFYADLAQAVADADLVIEAIPEVAKIKTDFYIQLGKVAVEKTIFATNSSTLLPSQFAEVTGRPDKFLALHFASGLWKNNTAEVMKHLGTDQKVFQDVIEFAKNIGMVALPLYKEQPGYILNSLWVPFLEAAQLLLMNQVADIETIDKTWMIATGAPEGPFAILDAIGINSAFNIVVAKANATRNPEFANLANLLKTEYLERASLAEPRGEAFTPILIAVLQARTSYEIDGYAINGSQKRLVTVGERALLRLSH
jgi:3-hydroxyacyl-CoA dehydrogenase